MSQIQQNPKPPSAEPPPQAPPAEPDEQLLFTILPIIQEAQDAFERDLPRLLKERPGEWVAYHGSQQIGFAKTKTELYQRCLKQGLELEQLLIWRIKAIPDEDFLGLREDGFGSVS